MAATPKPIRKQIKAVRAKHMKSGPKRDFGEKTKQEAKKNIASHSDRLKTHAKKHGQLAMPHHPNYSKSKIPKKK